MSIEKQMEDEKKEFCDVIFRIAEGQKINNAGNIFYGTNNNAGELESVYDRQYEFDLDSQSEDYMRMKLFIKSKELFFKGGNTTLVYGEWQRFVFTMDNLMSLSDSERMIIYKDFD